jgi:cytidylate kinase
MIPVVTIDGPSGAGKGTVARMVARQLGYRLLDSGALYRLTALAAERSGVDFDDAEGLGRVAAKLDVTFEVAEDRVITRLAGDDVSDAIRTEAAGMAASRVAACAPVRAGLLACQRGFQQLPGLVADGRDMGSKVFPGAEIKIFLTASSEERARRRVLQLQQSGETPDFDRVLADIEARDKADRERKESPLLPAPDAVHVDSTTLTIAEVVAQVVAMARAKTTAGA